MYVCDDQRTDNIVTRHKYELNILFSKYRSEKERKGHVIKYIEER
jgi:hypothetical protein